MLIEPYIYGAIINYNMKPTTAGKGSAIFLHVWHSSSSPTAECIAMDKKDLLMTLNWLDKAEQPYIFVY